MLRLCATQHPTGRLSSPLADPLLPLCISQVIRNYHGHLSGVYCIALHPTLDLIMTGGRDSTCRVWDMRTKLQVFALSGHTNTVASVLTQPTDPQVRLLCCVALCTASGVMCGWLDDSQGHGSWLVSLALTGRDTHTSTTLPRTPPPLNKHTHTRAQVITGSHDTTIRLWDLRRGATLATLTNHKKSVRALVGHPTEHAFASAGADNIKKFKLPNVRDCCGRRQGCAWGGAVLSFCWQRKPLCRSGWTGGCYTDTLHPLPRSLCHTVPRTVCHTRTQGDFLHNMLQQQRAIVNCMAVNEDGVLASGGDNGSLWMWDWRSGNVFQQSDSIVQPGSLDSEAGIYDCCYDMSGSR